MEKLMIAAVVNGGITSRGKTPNFSCTPEEIAESVYQCWQTGASIAHIHARDLEGSSSYEFCVWKEVADRVLENCGINFERAVA